MELSETFKQVTEVDDLSEKFNGDSEQLLASNDTSRIKKTPSDSRRSGFKMCDFSSEEIKKHCCFRCLTFVCSLSVAIACVLLVVFIIPCKHDKRSPPAGINTTTELNGSITPSTAVSGTLDVNVMAKPKTVLHWKTGRYGLGTEGPVRLLDVNQDGILDVIVSYVSTEANSAMAQSLQGSIKDLLSLQKECVRQHDVKKFDPCGGGVAALHGETGQLLWYSPSYMEVFALRCSGIDVNRDGRTDCLAAGRVGVLYAINTVNGSVLWEGDRKAINNSWNVFTPALIDDLDSDGVPEVLIANGGNQLYMPYKKNRDAGQLLVLWGKTGESIGRGYHMPDGHETYMSPVVMAVQDNSKIILFGSGGETVGGSLWAVRLVDLICYLTNWTSKLPGGYDCSKLDVSKWDWNGHPADRVSQGIPVHRLVKSRRKGVMVPPVLVDLNGDKVDEIVGMTFDGYIFAIDGVKRNMIWDRRMPGTQTYSSPAPALFNNDSIPDFMLQIVTGDWTFNNYSMTESIVIDGQNGTILWSMKSRRQMMSSPLSLAQTGQEQNDWFLFWVSGRVSWPDAKLTSFLPGESGEVNNLGNQLFMSVEDSLKEVTTQPNSPEMWRTRTENLFSASILGTHTQRKRHSGESNHDLDNDDESDAFKAQLLNSHKPADYETTKASAKCGVNEDIFTSELFAVNSFHSLCPVKVAEAQSFNGNVTNLGPRGQEDIKEVCYEFRPDLQSTIAAGDLNGDRLLEVALVKSWVSYVLVNGNYDRMDYYTIIEVLTVQVNATTHGVEGSFLPVSRQPWAGYLGTQGDSRYTHNED